jgi:hypothetical protein
MISSEDIERLKKLNEIPQTSVQIERGLRRQEAFLSYRMMRILTNEIRKLKKANDFFMQKTKRKKET